MNCFSFIYYVYQVNAYSEKNLENFKKKVVLKAIKDELQVLAIVKDNSTDRNTLRINVDKFHQDEYLGGKSNYVTSSIARSSVR